MGDVTKITFETKIVVSIVAGAIMMTTTVLTAWFSMKGQISDLRADIKLKNTVLEIRMAAVESIVPQVNINTLTLKTIADFIEPKKIQLKKYR